MTASPGELHAGKAPEAQAAAAKAQIVAKYAGLPLTVVTDEAGTSASLQLGGGTSIGGGRDGNAIAKYIAHVGGGGLYPRPPFGAASRHRASTIDAWLDFSASRVAHRFAAGVESAQTPKDLDAAKEQLLTDLAGLDSHLQAQTFLVGDTPSLADVAIAVDLRPAFEKVLDPAARQRVPHLARWFQTATAQPHFAQIPKKPVREKLTTEEGAAAARLSKKLVKLQTQMDLPPLRIDIERELRLAIPGDKGLAIQRAFSEMEFAQHGRRLNKIHKRLHGVASV